MINELIGIITKTDILSFDVEKYIEFFYTRVAGTKAIYQSELAVAIKRARHMALLPFVKE